MTALVFDLLRYFRLLLCNRWTELNNTWQEARSQRLLLCVLQGQLGEKLSPKPLIGWEIFELSSTSDKRNLTKLDRKQDPNFLYHVCDVTADQKTKIAALTSDKMIHSSQTTERNSTNLERKQDLNVFYQVCVLSSRSEYKRAILASYFLKHFRLFLWNHWTEFNQTW